VEIDPFGFARRSALLPAVAFRQPQDDVAVALAAATQRAQPLHHRPVQPDHSLALLVGSFSYPTLPSGSRGGDGLERLGVDRDAHHTVPGA
jgi:hypothetical protein